ncbi:MAG: hypothetical protein CMN29_28400 [Sandaracinus sp.]|nr:hypothetical protein [Sandaracinus sp.]
MGAPPWERRRGSAAVGAPPWELRRGLGSYAVRRDAISSDRFAARRGERPPLGAGSVALTSAGWSRRPVGDAQRRAG